MLKVKMAASTSAHDVTQDELWDATATALNTMYGLKQKALKAGTTVQQRKKKSEQDLKGAIINVRLEKEGLDATQEKNLWEKIHHEFAARTNGKDLKNYYTK